MRCYNYDDKWLTVKANQHAARTMHSMKLETENVCKLKSKKESKNSKYGISFQNNKVPNHANRATIYIPTGSHIGM